MGKNTEKFHKMMTLTADHVAASISAALKARFDNTRHAAKLIASRAGTSPRTAEAWLTGDSAPRAAELMRLCAEFDEVFDAVLSMTGRHRDGIHLTASQRDALVEILRNLEGNANDLPA